MATGWELIFDLADPRGPEQKLTIGLVVFLALVAIVWYWRATKTGGQAAPALFVAFIAASILMVGLVVPAWDTRKTLGAVRDGSARQIEGAVTHHRQWQERSSTGSPTPLSPTGTMSNRESITVGGVEFEFTAGEYERQMERRGLTPVAMREGLWLRIVWRDRGGEPKDRHVARLEWSPSRSSPP